MIKQMKLNNKKKLHQYIEFEIAINLSLISSIPRKLGLIMKSVKILMQF